MHEQHVARVVARAAKGLKVVALVLAVGCLVNGYLTVTIDQNSYYSPGSNMPRLPFRMQLDQFLSVTTGTLAWIALVAAAAYGLQVAAASLARGSSAAGGEVVGDPSDPFEPATPPVPVPLMAPRPTRPAASDVNPNDDIWKP